MPTKYKSILLLILFVTPIHANAKQHKVSKHNHKMTGIASWYSYQKSNHTHKTASGELFSPNKLTAAHRTLPFGTKVKVTNTDNKKSVVVTINDRGPFVKGRIIDLSKSAAKAIELDGIQKVNLHIIS